jgi:hypothetical protein
VMLSQYRVVKEIMGTLQPGLTTSTSQLTAAAYVRIFVSQFMLVVVRVGWVIVVL